MDFMQMYELRESLLNDLDNSIKEKRKRGLDLANSEANYRMLMTQRMAEVMIQGYEYEDGTTKPIAATAAYDFVRGLPEVAKLRQKRDGAKVLVETVQEHIYAVKVRLRVVEQDIQNVIQRGV